MRKTGCKKLMFTQRGLFIVGSIFMVFGFVCVILNKSLTKSLSGKIWNTVNEIDVKKFGAQLVDPKDVVLSGTLNITGTLKGERNVYYYSPTVDFNTTFTFTLVNITANISVYISADIPLVPTLVTPLQRPFNACGVTYFNFYNGSKPNLTYTALFSIGSFESSEICTFKWLTALFPAAATLLLLGGCVAVAYWGYEKMTHPEEEMYNVVGAGKLKIQNF
eukprot:TRINITY_DN7979_c0_g1_i1.p1 TRINITY_DN7979_c0_g1~~TRINITY_DN7979_c0_g1_i1.p1  ORF type:complete len:220 (+),score=57.84 TRINITY_DN7979_c0_g1_i1:97-756(+)